MICISIQECFVGSAAALILEISKVTQLIEISGTSEISFGGIICVICPALSFVNDADLNPVLLSEVLPKFELELVIDKSPPLLLKK